MLAFLAQAKPTYEIVNNIPSTGVNYVALVLPGLVAGVLAVVGVIIGGRLSAEKTLEMTEKSLEGQRDLEEARDQRQRDAEEARDNRQRQADEKRDERRLAAELDVFNREQKVGRESRQRAFISEARVALIDYAASDYDDMRTAVELSSLADMISDSEAARCVRLVIGAKETESRLESTVLALDALAAAMNALDSD